MRLLVTLVALASAAPCGAQPKPGWKLTFQDQFDGAGPDYVRAYNRK